MRTRRLAAVLTVAILTVPILSTTAGASSPEHKCEKAMGTQHKCDDRAKD